MSEWRAVTLGDVLDVSHGFAFKGEYFTPDEGDVLLTPRNFLAGGGLDVSRTRSKYYEGPFDEKYVLEAGDVVVAMTDLKQDAPILGSAGTIPPRGRYLHNQRIGKVVVRDSDLLAREFVPWLLNSPGVRAQIRATATGATVRHSAPVRIAEVATAIPGRRSQTRIAAVLGAFDDLIEINEWRIALLEDLTRSLYREWFVRFRFPDRDRNAQTGSKRGPLPANWTTGRLGDVVTLRYGKALPAKARRPGSFPVVSSAGVVGDHETPLVEAPGVVVGRKGNVGSVWWIDHPYFPIDTTYYVETDAPLGFIYWQLRHLSFVDSHAAVPGLSRDQAYSLPVLVPERSVSERFDRVHRTCFESMGQLRSHNRALARTRDLLLPRLVAGRLDISDIDMGNLLPEEHAA